MAGWRSMLAMIIVGGCATMPEGPGLRTVPHVDLERYQGTWYEIATIPAGFQKGCAGVTAAYSLRPDGKIKVVNRCRQGNLEGPEREVVGRAWIVDRNSNAKLKVSFFLWFAGDYWIIDLAPDYSYAVVGHPSRKYLWILSRTPVMAGDVYQGLLPNLRSQGYDLTRLKKTPQPGVPPEKEGPG